GAGWVARLLLNGIDVSIFDPDPEASRKVGEVMKGARRAYKQMLPGGLPKEGKLTFAKTIGEAVADADFIQESVPERLDLKHKVLAEIDAHAPANSIIGSSTSGIKPTDMQVAMKKHPERLVVGHPFNPVYLLPLVEIVDDIMRYSFGLRWAQMGMFQVYRVAGGEAGMRHFMAQFGPCLKWPWTKLMDVPEFNDELVDLIATQSDEQANGLSIRELEKIRDDNLVAIMDALSKQNKGKGWGAGALHKDYTRQLAKLAAKPAAKAGDKAKAAKPAKKMAKPAKAEKPTKADKAKTSKKKG
ncbi:MAG: L-carnitine dehydrogenase, partial [Mesorhizobium sp.]